MAKIVFMGTPDFAVPTLKALTKHHEVIGVVTQPDRPAGRKQQIKQSPIKEFALEHDIPTFQPEKIRAVEAIETLKQWQAEVYVVAAFGQILPQAVLDIPEFGSINIHASLLPRWRGASPIHASIKEGDEETGITIMQMDAGLDTGPILSQATIVIDPDETGQSLHDKLAGLGGDLLVHTLPGYLSGTIKPRAQSETGITYAPQIDKKEGHIDWNMSSRQIERLVRAFTPWPSTFTHWNGKQLKILGGHIAFGEIPPGEVVEYDWNIAIGTGDGLFVPTTVQLAGKKPASFQDFLRGYPNFVGSVLE